MKPDSPYAAQRAAIRDIRAGLARDFAALRARLEAVAAGAPVPLATPEPGSTLAMLARLFGLDAAEREVLCLAAGAELEPRISEAVRSLRQAERPDVGLALALRPEDGWEALCPDGPLRRWRLIELTGSGPMMRRQLSVDERVLHFLMGLNYRDARLEGLVSLVAATRPADARERPVEERLAAAWQAGRGTRVVLLAGSDGAAKREIAARAAEGIGLKLLCLDGADIPADWTPRSALATFVEREVALSGAALLIECREAAAPAPAARLADALTAAIVVAAPDPAATEHRSCLRLEVPPPERGERRALWREVVGPRAEALGAGLDRLAEQFALDRSGIKTAAGAALDGVPVAPDKLFGRLWQAARQQARRQLDGLAERIDSCAVWEDLVLPAEQMSQLRDLAAHVNEAWRVNEEWGWRAKSPRGLGAAGLFAGPSGTGKTLAAEVLSAAIGLDLYRIDLSQVVSKYIGETEKNLARIFAAAEDGGAILLFDEADALFGKRSEVKDSHDRYANIEVSYLLQRMEAYRGLAILTTNQKSALDQAFLRRLRAIVTFPFPDAVARTEIWRRIFPERTPTEGLDPARLARMNLTGGSIRSIALNASFLAAGAGSPVRLEHVRTAARREYAKLEKSFTASEMEAVA